ncbi:hypothetical protein CENSYa_1023 [Cenarchaeum symbiosum A]|uniref:Uncharacterized protein n=1 Tax=Cenarchaeum symbiosum (strain A) TaxID=414004 RepID=A0RWD8_CENSY|nr:hypothetical protein CENSYa_1023 [Cenarchaeum symbiosum A]
MPPPDGKLERFFRAFGDLYFEDVEAFHGALQIEWDPPLRTWPATGSLGAFGSRASKGVREANPIWTGDGDDWRT